MVVMHEERPWGATLAALGAAGRTCQLTVREHGPKLYRVAFADGRVVGAVSPAAPDAISRIAVTSKLATAKQVAAAGRPPRDAQGDELDAFAVALGLTPDQREQLKQRVLVQRAARTFAVEHGELEVEDRVTIPTIAGVHVDVRAVVYHGARLVIDQTRLSAEVHRLGSRFVLTATEGELARFGFTDAEQPVLEALRRGSSGPEIEARYRELDPRMIQAILYALASCGAVARVSSPAVTAAAPKPAAKQPTKPPPIPKAARRTSPELPTGRRERTRPATPSSLARGTRNWTEPFLDVRATTVRPNALTAAELRGLIIEGGKMLERGVDHFTLLGVPIGASVEAVRTAYIELARNLRPERLNALGIRDQEFHARALFAQICIAFTTLTEPERRAEYVAGLRRSGLAGGELLDFAKLAAEAFERGERALRADDPELAVAELRTACELAPDDIDYLATLSQAEFSAASLKRR